MGREARQLPCFPEEKTVPTKLHKKFLALHSFAFNALSMLSP